MMYKYSLLIDLHSPRESISQLSDVVICIGAVNQGSRGLGASIQPGCYWWRRL